MISNFNSYNPFTNSGIEFRVREDKVNLVDCRQPVNLDLKDIEELILFLNQSIIQIKQYIKNQPKRDILNNQIIKLKEELDSLEGGSE